MSFKNAGVLGGGRLIAGAGRGAVMGATPDVVGCGVSAAGAAVADAVATDPKAVKLGMLGTTVGEGAVTTL